MSKYIFAYHGGKTPETPEACSLLMARWDAWISDLGAAMVNPGAPVGKSSTVSAAGVTDDGGANPLSGYSVVEADSLEAALAMAKGSPVLDHGTIEVAEIIRMYPGAPPSRLGDRPAAGLPDRGIASTFCAFFRGWQRR